MKLRRVILYGHLRKRFGKEFLLAVESPAEAIRALCTVIDGFRAHMLKYSEPGYRVLVGGEVRGKDELHARWAKRKSKSFRSLLERRVILRVWSSAQF